MFLIFSNQLIKVIVQKVDWFVQRFQETALSLDSIGNESIYILDRLLAMDSSTLVYRQLQMLCTTMISEKLFFLVQENLPCIM